MNKVYRDHLPSPQSEDVGNWATLRSGKLIITKAGFTEKLLAFD